MSRFKEISRIEAAIKHKSDKGLSWAFDYAHMRVKTAPNYAHAKT